MTVKEVYDLRTQGRIEEAYDAIRSLYAVDKRPYTSLAMFLTASDILRKRVGEGLFQEAELILKALERMLPQVPDKEGWVKESFEKSRALLNRKEQHTETELSEHIRMGIWGEELAASYLRQKGFVILGRDWHSVHRDIDIVAQDGNTMVFVEVKTRRNRDFGDPVQAVDAEKRHNLRKAINHYIKYHKINIPYRFDVITIVGEMGTEMPDITHIEDFNIMDSPSQNWYKKQPRSRKR